MTPFALSQNLSVYQKMEGSNSCNSCNLGSGLRPDLAPWHLRQEALWTEHLWTTYASCSQIDGIQEMTGGGSKWG